MTVKELQDFADGQKIVLKDCRNGREYTATHKYPNAIATRICARIDNSKDGRFATPVIVAWVLHESIKKDGEPQ